MIYGGRRSSLCEVHTCWLFMFAGLATKAQFLHQFEISLYRDQWSLFWILPSRNLSWGLFVSSLEFGSEEERKATQSRNNRQTLVSPINKCVSFCRKQSGSGAVIILCWDVSWNDLPPPSNKRTTATKAATAIPVIGRGRGRRWFLHQTQITYIFPGGWSLFALF